MKTDRSTLTTTVNYSGPQEKQLNVQLDADRLSLPEIGRYFRPLAAMTLEPSVHVRGQGTLDALNLDVDVASPAGSARGPLVGHFGDGPKKLEGRLEVRDVNMAPILNRPEWKTRVTGAADFGWTFSPAQIDFKFAGPQVEGFGYQAAKVRADGRYEPSRLAFTATAAAYGATATTRATFRFATPARPLSYTLEGTFRDLDVRRLPDRLSIPGLETRAAGGYRFEAAGPNWRGDATLDESSVEGARFGQGTVLGIESRNRAAQLFGQRPHRTTRPSAFRCTARDQVAG